MPMSPRLLRPRASAGYGLDAMDWRSRVIANGGTVSASTMKAVDTFCKSIVTNGLRDRFYRLNLFCGDNLSACLVPLFRGPDRTGTQYGNTTDTNNGPFVSGDYAETGASGGLLGNGTSKYLATGLAPDDIGPTTGIHLGIYQPLDANPAATRDWIGSLNVGASQRYYTRTGTGGLAAILGGTTNFGGSLPVVKGLLVIQRNGSGVSGRYDNGTLREGTVGTITPGANAFGIHVFTSNNGGSPSALWHNDRLISYSVGKSFTDTQNATFSTIMATFQTALSRNV